MSAMLSMNNENEKITLGRVSGIFSNEYLRGHGDCYRTHHAVATLCNEVVLWAL